MQYDHKNGDPPPPPPTQLQTCYSQPNCPQESDLHHNKLVPVRIACEQQTHFRSSRERSDDRKCVCCSQATVRELEVQLFKTNLSHVDTKGTGLSVSITEVSVLQTRRCMTLGNFETTQTVHNRDVSVGRGFTVLLLTKLARCYILVDGREAKSFLANEPKTHK